MSGPLLWPGTCYRDVNGERIGETGSKSHKGVFLMSQCEGAWEILRGERKKAAKPARRDRSVDRRFCRRRVSVTAATAVAERVDARWQKRRRVFNSLLIMLFVFRLVAAPLG